MTTAFLPLLYAVLPIFVAIGCGFALRRTNKLEREADPSLLRVALNFLYPCFIADTVLNSAALKKADTLLMTPTMAASVLLLSYLVCFLVSRILRLGKPQPHGTFVFSAGTQNWGYLPIPIIQTFFPEDLGVLLIHSVGLELALWSVGVWILGGKGSWRQALTVPFFAVLGSLLLNLIGAGNWLPKFVLTSLHLLGQAAIPLSLLLTGATLADQVQEGGLSRNKTATVAGCILRLAILPMMILAIAKWVSMPAELQRILAVQAAMPAAMIPVILAKHYKADSGLALSIIIITTLLGLLTIPLWLRIGFSFLNFTTS